MKIRLIEPKPPTMHMWSYSAYPRLGLPMIGAALKQRGHDVLIYFPKMAPIDWADVHGADIVGISATTSTATAAFRMADALRAAGIPVVIGGSHVTFMADEALGHADYVARGEGGDALMVELVEALEEGRELDDIKGLSFMRDGQAVHNEVRPACPDLDELPLPDFSLFVGQENMASLPIMTSWGCPFDCNFCSVTAMFGRKYRFRSEDSVMAELIAKRPKRIFFYDDNLAANKNRLKRLLQKMIDAGIVVPWQAQMRTDVAKDEELLDLMKRSGCERIALGLESVNQETLDHFEKSQSVDDIVHCLDTLHRHGILTHGMFVLGAGTETVQSVRDTISFALEHHVTSLMLNIMTPLPGTLQYDEMDAAGRIFDRDWEHYDAQHVVFLPERMTPRELMRETLHGYRRFYSTRLLLGDVARLDFNDAKIHAWCWWFARSWHVWGDNWRNMKGLRHVPVPPAVFGGATHGG
jgi:anaerobic magnesium-protoporphyrin IX monomethyl ester cyclase